MFDKADTRSRIILAAVELLGKQGDIDVTVRQIAKKADVNLASINYHFNSKSNLLQEIEQYFMQDISSIYGTLFDLDYDLEPRLTLWAQRLMQYLLDYPGVMFMWATKVIKGKGRNTGLTGLINDSESNLTLIVRELTGIKDEELLTFKVMQLMSGIVNPVIMYHGAGKSFKVDIKDEKVRNRYLDTLINNVI
jgi:AcrR family transcriptional regulator